MTRGFITIATGNKHYYEIAANLLQSYRFHTKNRMPFAIIAEEENEYTAQFDDVIITNEATRSFMDKYLLMKLCPYDETIFFDADSLAFGDLNAFWDLFKDATDFSTIGCNFDLYEKGAWYNVEDIWKYGEKITYKVRSHTGICFVRKSDKLQKLYDDCLDILANYDKVKFIHFKECKDEAILGIAMPMNNMRATSEPAHMLAVTQCLTHVEADILRGYLAYTTDWGSQVDGNGIFFHFGTKNTFAPLYRFESERLSCRLHNISGGGYNLLYNKRWRMPPLYIYYFFKVVLQDKYKWVVRKIRRCMHKIRNLFKS